MSRRCNSKIFCSPTSDGRGRIHLLDASRLVHEAPKVYATFLLWLLAELFEQLPERGDADKPLLALFFDEAHLLFADTPKALQDRLEQVVRLDSFQRGGGVFRHPVAGGLARHGAGTTWLAVSSTACGPSPPKSRNHYGRWRMVSGPTRQFDALAVLTELGTGEALVGTLAGKRHAGSGPARVGCAAAIADRPAERG